jgi:DNA primase small subunit
VCIPIDPACADDFDPLTVPTVRTLCEEINQHDSANPDAAGIDDVEKTSLKTVIQLYNKTFYDDMKITNRKIIGEDYKKKREEQLHKQDEGNAMEWTY